MLKKTDFYIDGEWVPPYEKNDFPVINPSNEDAFAIISLGGEKDLNKAVLAAKSAFQSWSIITLQEKLALIKKLLGQFLRQKSQKFQEQQSFLKIALRTHLSFQ